ncbi:hypothetical protein Bca52824_049629 [Brassica carinata]|uniref:Uncharacterized protein n=1 Tax=Brassica carinata TaxID=52824 RepID=A0A8X7URY0_BRACI|nr:hypothetical protein Bca52824_049629 [Brassica carinata]
MSDHFVFPPSQHEDLPLDDDDDEPVLQEVGSKDEQSLYGDEPALGTSRQYVESVGSESAMYEHGLIDSEPNESAEGGLDVRSDTAEDTLGLEKDGKRRDTTFLAKLGGEGELFLSIYAREKPMRCGLCSLQLLSLDWWFLVNAGNRRGGRFCNSSGIQASVARS